MRDLPDTSFTLIVRAGTTTAYYSRPRSPTRVRVDELVTREAFDAVLARYRVKGRGRVVSDDERSAGYSAAIDGALRARSRGSTEAEAQGQAVRYIQHPVARRDDPHDDGFAEASRRAGLLHDVVEETDVGPTLSWRASPKVRRAFVASGEPSKSSERGAEAEQAPVAAKSKEDSLRAPGARHARRGRAQAAEALPQLPVTLRDPALSGPARVERFKRRADERAFGTTARFRCEW